MGNWDAEQILNIRKLSGTARIKCIGYNIWEKRTTQGISFSELNDWDVILGYDSNYQIYVAWNAAAHRIIDSCAHKHTFSLHKRAQEIEACRDPMICYYQILQGCKKQPYSAQKYYEKIVLIRESALEEFLKNALYYLMPNTEDSGYQPNTVYEDVLIQQFQISNSQNDGVWRTLEERKRYCCERWCRERSFRERVLAFWNFRCAICGETIQEVLQAAHIVPVKDFGSDNTDNGICLCANHHLMFDRKMFQINTETWVIECVDENLIGKMPDHINRALVAEGTYEHI